MVVLVLSGIIPLLLSFWPPLKFWQKAKALFISIALIVIIYGTWDIFATYRHHWYFNPRGVYPLRIINLPLEEVLFFVIITFCCIFTWEAINYIRRRLR